MEGDNWKDETLPGRRVGSDRSAADEDVRRDRLAITVRVLGSIVVLLALTLCGLWSLYLLRGRAVYVGPTPTSVVWTPTSASISIASPHPPSAEMNKPSPTASLDCYWELRAGRGYGWRRPQPPRGAQQGLHPSGAGA